MDDAYKNLEDAMSRLHAAVKRQGLAGSRQEGLESEIHTLSADRAKLAERLDKAEARAAHLERVNREVSQRLVAAMETIRSVVDQTEEKA